MAATKRLNGRRNCLYLAVLGAAAPAVLVLLPDNAQAATVYYHLNSSATAYGIANSGVYSWDTSNWATTSTAGPSESYPAGSFPEFNSTATPYTVTVNNDESNGGVDQAASASTVTINASGSGKLDEVSGADAFIAVGSLVINAPIVGPGDVAPESTGNLFLYGNNSYTGGTTIGYSSATLTWFNNNNSFGTGPINNNSTVAARLEALLGTGGTTITLPNNFTANTTAGDGFNFAANPNTPVVSTGTWAIGSVAMVLKNNGDSTSPLTLQGVISGSAGMTYIGANGGAIILTAANLYSGTTTVGASGSAAITLKLGAANTIASSSQVIMQGGTLDPDGFNQNMSSTTLALIGTSPTTSQLTYSAGNVAVDFANSSAVAWTSGDILNLTNWSSFSLLRFGTDSTGLTSAQLADIEFNGNAATLGTAMLTPTGYVVPEPTTIAMLLVGAPMLTARRRRA